MSLAGPIVMQDDEASSAGQRAYDRLRRMIIAAELMPGTVLFESGLMAQLDIGRTPLREALRRLSDEGFITIYPRRGLVVRQLGLADAQHLFDARTLVEPANARAAASSLDARGRSELEAIAARVEQAERAGDFRAFIDADVRLHLAIARLGGNRLLTTFTDRLLSISAWMWCTHLTRHGIQASDYASHVEIVDAIGQGDGNGAAAAMARHVDTSRELLRLAL